MAILYILPILSGLVLLLVLRNDRRRQLVQNRLAALKAGDDQLIANVSLSRLRIVTSRSLSVSALLPQRLRARLDIALEATGNRIGIVHLLATGLIVAVIVNVFAVRILSLTHVFVMLLTVGAAVGAPVALVGVAQSRYKNHFLNVFPDALDLIGRGIKAGLPINEALVVAGQEIIDPVGSELRRTLDQVQLGVPMIDALDKAADRVRVADFRFFVVALALQAKTGGSLAETLANLSGVIRARKALRLKARALSAEGKASAMVLAVLPFIVGSAMYVINRDLVLPLFVDFRGRFMVGIALVSLISGLTMMYLLIRRAAR